MSDIQEFWFVARTKRDQEIVVRESLKKINIGHYLPTQHIIRQLKYRRKKVEVPLIRNMIFIRATKEMACSAANDFGVPLYYIKDYMTRSMLFVPEKQMNDFMFVLDTNPDGLSYDTEKLVVGEKVQVVKGQFCGVEGELVSEGNGSYVVVRIPQVLSVSVRIPRCYLKKI